MSSSFLQQLLRRLYAEPQVLAVYLAGDLLQPAAESLEQIDLRLAAETAFQQGMAGWLAPLGDMAHSGPDQHGWTVITPDGAEWRFRFYGPADEIPSAGLQPLFDRRPDPSARAGRAQQPDLDLGDMAGRFWRDMYRAARALERGRALTAHRWLEACAESFINLYRLALAPGAPGDGWEGAEAIPGLAEALAPIRTALVAPLERRAQWRSAHRVAAAYEGLMLPLCERLGVAYPMTMRSLAFRRLDQARPDRVEQPGPDRSKQTGPDRPRPEPQGEGAEPPVGAPGRLRVARGRIRRPGADSATPSP